ncbi:grasp-with-spasm system SPASM domain peptide maturase [Olivibacter jilunii]|uniref:grasp-with-spasm system SPASM domain peptide maturase n=1 Tax=Olivibacter jilunii TaxID=985016 RepID=UPI003F16802F
MMNKYFILYSCCIPVKGAKRSIVCDLQRENYLNIPNVLYYILTKFQRRSIEFIKDFFDRQQDKTIDEYFEYLIENEYGFFSDSYERFPKVDLSKFYNYQKITNAIVDYDDNSKHDIGSIVEQLSELFCESLELRFFSFRSMSFLDTLSKYLEGSTLRSVQLIFPFGEGIDEKNLIDLQNKNPRIKRIIVHSSPYSKIVETVNMIIYFSKDKVISENCCGVVSSWYFSINTASFSEAKSFNSCLNKKVSIDKNGLIKNCPSMEMSFGKVGEVSIENAIDLPGFKDLWQINKDKIEVCSDCEFRYICQDCRAYRSNPENMLSKPLKCSYNPYED